MFDKDRWIEIFETIKKNKLRTFLAGFTVALGIFIFIMLFGLANGLENTFEKYFKDDQLNTIWINGSRTSKPYAGYESNRRIRFKNEDLEDIQNKFNFFINGITPRITISSEVGYRLKSNNYTVRGVGPHHQFNEMTVIMDGRYINEADIFNKERNVVIGRLVKQDLFGNEDPIGKFVNVGAGTITCNYDGFKKSKTKIKDNVFIGSNSSLVAPLTIEEGSVVGAGSVITKNVRKKSLALTRSLQAEIKNYKRKKK